MSDIQAMELDEEVTPRETEVNMSVYTYPYRWNCWAGFWSNIKQWFDNRKAAKQRAKRGYCYGDVWECGDSIIDHMIVMLVEYRNKTNGYPATHFSEFKDWIAYIDEMIDLLEYSRKDLDKLNDYYPIYDAYLEDRTSPQKTEEWLSVRDRYFEENERLYISQKEARKKALAMFAEYSDAIWW